MRAEATRRAVLLGALLLGCCAIGDNLRQPLEFTVVKERLLLNGQITSRSVQAFEEVLAQNPQVSTVVLQDMPGSLDDTAVLRMGTLIRNEGLTTALQSDSRIHSGAVDLFIAGARRKMVEGAEIGVHSWADGLGDGRDYPRDALEHRAGRGYAAAMLGAEDFYWFTLQAAPSDGIYIMNAEEIARFGLLTEPPVELN